MTSIPEGTRPKKSRDPKGLLRYVALFLGEVRDGLTMINMQSAFMIVSKNYSEKQAGILFFVFGMSQFLFQTPAGYLMDYTDHKILWLSCASAATTVLTLLTAAFAQEKGGNLLLMVLIKFVQGAVTSFIPPGLNSITQGIVGSVGMTKQVAMNEMCNHFGTAVIVLTGSLLGFALYPNIGSLFIVSPIACAGVLFFLNSIHPDDIDHAAARGLVLETKGDIPKSGSKSSLGSGYKPPAPDSEEYGMKSAASTDSTKAKKKSLLTTPSFNFGWGSSGSTIGESNAPKADTPLQVLRNPTLLTFTIIVFLFHTANGTILPLVMQSLAIGNGRSGILFSGLCIIVAQLVMVASAKICGDYSTKYGRKVLFLIGFFSVPVRCAILTLLTHVKNDYDETPIWLQVVILSTQILDGVGAGTFGTMYILVTSDLAGGTGRFSMILGVTTAAMSIGGTVSGYLGQAMAEDISYLAAFAILGVMGLVPALLYLFCMPETLPEYAREESRKDALSDMMSIAEHEEESGKNTKPYVELT